MSHNPRDLTKTFESLLHSSRDYQLPGLRQENRTVRRLPLVCQRHISSQLFVKIGTDRNIPALRDPIAAQCYAPILEMNILDLNIQGFPD